MQKGSNRALRLFVFVGLVCFSIEAKAQQAPGMVGGGASADPTQGSFVPSAFIIASDPFAGSSFASCDAQMQLEESTRAAVDQSTNFDAKNMATQSIAAMVGGRLGGASNTQIAGMAVSGGGNCEDTPITLGVSDIDTSCDNYMMGGKFQEERLNKAISKAKEAASLASCKARKASQSSKLVNCFKTEYDNFKKSLDLVKKDFETNLASMNKYVGDVKADVEKEAQKAEQMDQRVGAFSQQIQDIQSALETLSSASGDGAIANVEQSIQTHKERVLAFEKELPRQQASMIFLCASGRGAKDTAYSSCPANLAAASMPECLFSYYHGYVKQSAGGGNAGEKKAGAQIEVFRHEVHQMLGDFTGTSPTVSEAAFFARHRGTLSKYGKVGEQLGEEIRKCIKEAPVKMKALLSDPATDLGSSAAALANEATKISASMGQTLNAIDPAIRNAGKEIYGQELNQYFDAYRCNEVSNAQNATAAPQARVTSLGTQLSCIKNLTGTMRALLNGGVPPGADKPIQVPLKVTNAQGQPVLCQGLRDCAAKAQEVAEGARTRIASLKGSGTFTDARCPQGCPGLKKFHKDANQQVRTAFQSVADLLSSRVAVMTAQFDRVKGLLGKFGINFAKADSEGLDMDSVCPISEDAVCPVPADFDKIISKLAGVSVVSEDGFDKAVTDAKATAEENTKLAQDYNERLEVMTDQLAACRKAADDKAVEGKLVGIERKRKQKLNDCKRAVRSQPTTTDFGSYFEGLSDDVAKICGETKGESCTAMEDSINSGEGECSDFANDRQQQNKTMADLAGAISGRSNAATNVGGK